MVDIESDGPIPGDYSMIAFGAVVVDENLDKTFYGKLKPIADRFDPEALKVSGFTREETLAFDDPKQVMLEFEEWVKNVSVGRPIFISDNNGFDWMFICWYCFEKSWPESKKRTTGFNPQPITHHLKYEEMHPVSGEFF